MRERRPRLIAVAAVLACGIVAAPASAVAPVALGTGGTTPAVAVDAAGTGHFVWASSSGSTRSVINYCRIPKSQLACQGRQTLAALGLDFSQPRIFVRASDGAIVVIDSRCCASGPNGVDTYSIISTDGGNTWQPPVKIGGQFDEEGGVMLTPDGSSVDRVSMTTTSATYFERDPLAGPQQTSHINLDLLPDGTSTGPNWYYGQVAYLPSGNPLVVFGDLNNLSFRMYNGGDINAQGSWTPNPPTLIGPGENAQLASGPAGLFLFSDATNTSGAPRPAQLRQFTGGGFGAPRTVSGAGENTSSGLAIAEDGSGTLHLVWGDGHGNLLYSRSSGTGLTPEFHLVSGGGVNPAHLRVAANNAHIGWAVWDEISSTGTAFAVPLTLAATVAPPSFAPGKVIGLPSNKKCVDTRNFVVPVHQPASDGRVTDAKVLVNGKQVKFVTGTNLARVKVPKLPLHGTFVVEVDADTTLGFVIKSKRTYHGCSKSGRTQTKHHK